jgi:hypothetical protein
MLGIGVSCLGLAAGAALTHRFYSTACLLYQVTILRLLKRPDNPRWNAEELSDNQELLNKEREKQMKALKRSKLLLITSALLLARDCRCRFYICDYSFLFRRAEQLIQPSPSIASHLSAWVMVGMKRSY